MTVEVLNGVYDTGTETLRKKAVASLDRYLKDEENVVLRTDQVDVMQDLHDFLASGKTAGYISLPPGSGKTVLASEIAKVLKAKAVVLSPTQTILKQTGRRFDEFSPDVNVSDFYARKKDLSGDVLNTTYQSFLILLEKGLIKPEEIELIFCDELHMALGEERHKIWRQVPNAIKIGLTATAYFTPLDGYEKRGIVDPNEEWVGLFREKIHSMSIEEAIEKGILAPLDVHLVRTKVKVTDVSILSTGEYNKGQLERELNTIARNYMTMAMIAGFDVVPAVVHFSEEQKKEISEIHEKIKGKRTAIFGLSIDHVNELAELLRQKGVSARAYHSGINFEERDEILEDHKNGNLQVILGVDALRVGWDSPETEVGIYLAPTRSGIVAVQELGRILRPSPETGKERAIAIQFADQFTERDKAPILIPDIFDPYYVLRGVQEGREVKKGVTGCAKTRPVITFSGLDVEAIIKESKTNEFLRERFQTADIDEISGSIEEVIDDIKSREENISTFEFYKQITRAIPRVTAGRQQEALQMVASLDSNIAKHGAQVVIFTGMGTIFSGIERYLGESDEENSEILTSAIVSVYDKISTAKVGAMSVSQTIYVAAQRGAAQYIAKREGVSLDWVLNGAYSEIKKAVEDAGRDWDPISGNDFNDLCEDLADKTGIDRGLLRGYISSKYGYYKDDLTITEADAVVGLAINFELKEKIDQVLTSVTARERKVLEMRFGVGEEDQTHTLGEISEVFQTHPEWIRQIEAKALDKIRIHHYAMLGRQLRQQLEPPTYPSREQTESLRILMSIQEIKRPEVVLVPKIEEEPSPKESGEKTMWEEWLEVHPEISPKDYMYVYPNYAFYRDRMLMEGRKLWPESWTKDIRQTTSGSKK